MVASNYKPNSEIALLNQRPLDTPITITSDLYNILEIAIDIHNISDGFYDISLGKVSSELGFAPSFNQDLKQDLLSGYLLLDNYTISKSSNNWFDLSSIAKGYAVDLIYNFLDDKEIKMLAVEAAGLGLSSGKHAASLSGGKPGVLHGNKTYLLQNQDGQIEEAHSISAGLDYPGIGPEHSFLFEQKRVKYVSATDEEALEAFKYCCKTEGIIPALEPAHALAALIKIAPTMSKDEIKLTGADEGVVNVPTDINLDQDSGDINITTDIEHSDAWYDYTRNDPNAENPFTDPVDRARAERVVRGGILTVILRSVSNVLDFRIVILRRALTCWLPEV